MGYDISGKKSDLKKYTAGLENKFMTVVKKKNSQGTYMDSFADRPTISEISNQMYGGLLFIGIFVSIVMLIATVGFAIPAIQKMLVLLSMYDKLLIVKFGIVSLAVTFLGYVAVYKLTTNVYENIVNR